MPETYSYTGQQVSREVKAQFGDTGNVQINDELILRWINNGVREIARANSYLEKVFTTNLLADQAVYDLNALMDGLRVQNYSAVVVDNVKLQILPWQEYQDRIGAAAEQPSTHRRPQIASEYGGQLTLFPTPSDSIVDGIQIYFTAWPADLAQISDTLTVPDRYYNALVAYVLAQALELDENFEAAQVKLEQHNQAVGAEMQRDKMDPTDYYPTVVFDPSW